MAKTYTWIGTSGTAASSTIAADWSPSGGPPAIGDTAIIGLNGTVLEGDGLLRSNTVILDGGQLTFAGDGLVNSGAPSLDAASLIATATTPNVMSASVTNALGNFVNQGTILADGAAGSSLTINVGTTVINGTTVAGYSYNSGVIQADAGNTLTINVGASSEVFNTGSIVADGGEVRITVSPSAIAGGDAPARGEVVIEGGGTVETAAAYASTVTGSTQVYYFADSTAGNTLKIDNIGSFGGRINGFSTHDTIDLGTSLAVGTIVYSSATNVLNLENNGGTILASLLIASGAFASGTFAVKNGVADGFGIGSIVANGTTDTALTTSLTTPVASGASGTWQTAGSWLNGVVPGTADTPLIGQGTSSDFTLTTGGSPVSVAGINVTDPQATLRITSNVSAVANGIADRSGTLEVTGGNTVTAASLSSTEPQAAITIDAGATVDLTGHLNTNIAATAGTLSVNPGDSYANTFSSGSVVVDGSLLAGPAVTGGGGGGTSIGYDSDTSANVTVNTGGTVTDTHNLLGSDATSAGTLTLTGAGTSWTDAIDVTDTAHSSGYMDVGYNDLSSNTQSGLAAPGPAGTAQLLIENGATLTDQEGGFIGDSVNSTGAVTVTAGGFWNLDSNGVGYMEVGDAGVGTLSVLNGGSVAVGNVGTFFSGGTTFTAGGIAIGRSIGATGTITVNGTGSQLSTPNGISVGFLGQGSLNILNGGTVVTNGSFVVGRSAAAGSSGTIAVGGSGAAAALDFAAATGSLAAASGMTVGGASQGTVTVSANGAINMDGTAGIGIGLSAGAVGLVTVSGGSLTEGATATGIGVGEAGQGTLDVLNGGTVSVQFDGIGVGQTVGASGTVLVSGAGSSINDSATNGGIVIGEAGNGLLTVTNGGSVRAATFVTIGALAGGSGTVTVADGTLTAGSLFIDVAASQNATGLMTIGAGGVVDVASGAEVNNNGTLTMSGGLLTFPTGVALSIAAGGELDGFGQVVDPSGMNNAGTIVASGGALDLSDGIGAMGIAAGATLAISGNFVGTVSFNGGSGVLSLGAPGSANGTITGFGAGDTISLAGITVTGSSYADGVLTLNEASGSVALALPGSFATSDFAVTNGGGGAQVSIAGAGLLGSLNVSQQLELIYIAYFNRAADNPGYTYWEGQNVAAQNGGQNAASALTGIANAFAPQPETIALYPFLGQSNVDLSSPAGQTGLNNFVDAVYGNLFDRAADAAGAAYWVGQLTSGAVGLGAAALAIANGATGADAIEVQNKVAVALDFTTRTGTAGLGETSPLASSFLAAAKGVLSGVDGTSLNDASVTAGENATTAFINGSATGETIAGAMMASAASDTNVITVTGSGQSIDPGAGNYTIQFLPVPGVETLMLHAGGVDQVSGFDPGTDVLDFSSLLSAAGINLNGDVTALGNYVTITDQGADALVNFDPAGHGGGSTVAVLQGQASAVTGLDPLVARGAIRIT